jgi:hypothetical protein
MPQKLVLDHKSFFESSKNHQRNTEIYYNYEPNDNSMYSTTSLFDDISNLVVKNHKMISDVANNGDGIGIARVLRDSAGNAFVNYDVKNKAKSFALNRATMLATAEGGPCFGLCVRHYVSKIFGKIC